MKSAHFKITLTLCFMFGASFCAAQTTQPLADDAAAGKNALDALYNAAVILANDNAGLRAATQQSATDLASLQSQLDSANASLNALKSAMVGVHPISGSIATPLKTAKSGDIYLVADETISESIDLTTLTNVQVIAVHPNKVVVDGKNTLVNLLKTGATNTVVGFNFINAKLTQQTGAVLVNGNGSTLKQCAADNNAENGLWVRADGFTADTCDFSNNGRYGGNVDGVRNPKFINCTFGGNNVADNDASDAGGIKALYTDGLIFQGCKFYKNNGPGGWLDSGNTNGLIQGCDAVGNQKKNGRGSGPGIVVEQNNNQNPKLKTTGPIKIIGNHTAQNDYGTTGIALWDSAYVILSGNSCDDQFGAQQHDYRIALGMTLHDLTITGNTFGSSTYLTSSLIKSAADIKAKAIVMDQDKYTAKGNAIGYWCGGTQTTLTQLQAFGIEQHGTQP